MKCQVWAMGIGQLFDNYNVETYNIASEGASRDRSLAIAYFFTLNVEIYIYIYNLKNI